MKKTVVIDSTRCAACGNCMKHCMKKAIVIHQGQYAVVDAIRCVGCGVCAKACPGDFIVLQEQVSA